MRLAPWNPATIQGQADSVADAQLVDSPAEAVVDSTATVIAAVATVTPATKL